ncbi:hypothetical protein [Ureibacillus sp. GCM10028918]|uniref:hypothetical protein n=1 Tax=Ureibacillus sp. GCM10028918 TaxID=3273429 RepID=UPI0036178E68
MNISLLIRTDALYSLNFFIYLQNIYLNQTQREERFKFPYVTEMIQFYDNFEMKFKQLWEGILIKFYKEKDNGLDLKIFYEEKDLFYDKLFIPNSDSLKTYNEIHTGFEVWWSSVAGRFSVENVIENPMHNIYIELTNSLKKNEREPKKQLNISLIYDKCILSNTKFHSYFAVLFIMDIYSNKEELILKLQSCIS